MKNCSKCKQTLSLDCFYSRPNRKSGISSSCKSCVSSYSSARYEKHSESILEQTNGYKRKNKEKVKEANKEYQLARYTKLENRLQRNLRSRVNYIIKNKCSVSKSLALKYLDCSIEYFKQHIESQFQTGMTWENYGYHGWHIDHIVPISLAKSEEDFKKLSHYSNLRPLWREENQRKGARMIEATNE